jgi:hypothetical protein
MATSNHKGHSTHRGHETGNTVLSILGGIAVTTLIVGAIGLAAWREFGEPAIDPTTFCAVNGPSALTVIAIDASDPYDAVQIREIENEVRDLLGQLERGARLDIYTMNATRGALATRVFSRCNPGHAIWLDQVAGQPSQVERIYREEFADAIDRALSSTIEAGAADRSPIVESIRAIAADSLGSVGDAVPRRLIVASDLVQHSDVYSMFRSGVGEFETFSRSANYADAQTDLRGAQVSLVVILRSEYSRFQTRELLLWWEEYVRANSGRVTDFVRI